MGLTFSNIHNSILKTDVVALLVTDPPKLTPLLDKIQPFSIPHFTVSYIKNQLSGMYLKCEFFFQMNRLFARNKRLGMQTFIRIVCRTASATEGV